MQIRLAKVEDLEKIMNIINKRIDWMNKNNIKQWNVHGYLDVYTYEYFEEKIRKEHFYVATKDNVIVGAVALFEEDKCWDDDVKALYIHNLVGDINTKGVGEFLLKFAEEVAENRGIHTLRLDCQIDNEVLNNYYERLGYKIVGTCILDDYEGNKREKKLKNDKGE